MAQHELLALSQYRQWDHRLWYRFFLFYVFFCFFFLCLCDLSVVMLYLYVDLWHKTYKFKL